MNKISRMINRNAVSSSDILVSRETLYNINDEQLRTGDLIVAVDENTSISKYGIILLSGGLNNTSFVLFRDYKGTHLVLLDKYIEESYSYCIKKISKTFTNSYNLMKQVITNLLISNDKIESKFMDRLLSRKLNDLGLFKEFIEECESRYNPSQENLYSKSTFSYLNFNKLASLNYLLDTDKLSYGALSRLIVVKEVD